METISENLVYIVQKDNVYHQTLLEDIFKEENLKINEILFEDKHLKRYTRNMLMSEKEILKINVPEDYQKLPKNLEKLNLKNRYLVLVVANGKQLKALKELEIYNSVPFILPKVATWKDKYDFYADLINNLKIDKLFEDVLIVDLIIRLLIKSPDSWKEIKLVLYLAKEKNQKITQEYLQVYFPDVEFHNLMDFMLQALEGEKKTKSIQTANYFLDVRKYSPNWLLMKLRETVLEISLVYRAYRRGVIHLQPENRDVIMERANVVNWVGGKELSKIPKGKLYKYFNFIKNVPYQQFLEIESIFYNKDMKENIKTKLEFYLVLEQLRILDDKYPKKQFKRKSKGR